MECSRITSFNANGAFVVSTRVFGETFDDHKGTRLRGSGDGPVAAWTLTALRFSPATAKRVALWGFAALVLYAS